MTSSFTWKSFEVGMDGRMVLRSNPAGGKCTEYILQSIVTSIIEMKKVWMFIC